MQNIKNNVRNATLEALRNNVPYTIIGFMSCGLMTVWSDNGTCKII